MAFNADSLKLLVPAAAGPQLWSYQFTDTPATVDTAGYFPVGYGLRLGDVILVQQVNAYPAVTSITATGFHTVSAVSATQIDVNDALAITATDTD